MIKKFLIENSYAKNFNQMVEALEAERKAISKKQGYYDRTEQQILHAFELKSLTDDELLKLAKALKKLREERRENKIKLHNIQYVMSKTHNLNETIELKYNFEDEIANIINIEGDGIPFLFSAIQLN